MALLILCVWGCSAHDGPYEEYSQEVPDSVEPEARVSQTALDSIRAEDLSLTTSLFVQQLTAQLQRWAELDFEDPELDLEFEQEIAEHPHFHSFAIVEENSIQLQKGDFPESKIQFLKQADRNEQQAIYSDPYRREDKHYMLVAGYTGDQEYVVGEVDLSFIQSVIGDVAAVADANGNFFMAGENTQVHWEKEPDTDVEFSEAEVPELKWKISVQSEREEEHPEDRHYREGEVLARFESEQAARLWLEEHPDYAEKKHFGPFYILVHEEYPTKQMMAELLKETTIVSVEPNYLFEKQETGEIPNDEFFELYQFNLPQIRATEGWQITEGTEDVIIAVVDTGVDSTHQDLADKLVGGHNAFTDTADYEDEHGHGTHVAGIASAITNNVTGIAGVSWHNPIMPVKALDEQGEGSLYEITNGIMWATDQGAKVINLSLGDDQPAQMLYEAIRYAYERDVVLIAASGNENVGTPMYPAAYDEVLAVSAVDENQEKAIFSNYGEYIDVTAPGQNIPSTFLDDQYVFMSGTSMAAPHVTGLVALIRSLEPELTNEEVMQLIRETADDLGQGGFDPYFGYGQINVFQALQFLEENDPQVLSQMVEERLAGSPQETGRVEQTEEGSNERDGGWLQEWLNRLVEQFSFIKPLNKNDL